MHQKPQKTARAMLARGQVLRIALRAFISIEKAYDASPAKLLFCYSAKKIIALQLVCVHNLIGKL
jgi:ABC-type dipeptide/oligopeptide/nickel transport system permease subunit